MRKIVYEVNPTLTTKILMWILLLWFVVGACMPLLEITFSFPFFYFQVPLEPTTDDQAMIILRLQIVRAASFMTMAYFIFKYLRNRKPLSSVVPVLVFINFLIFFSVIYTLRSGYVWTWKEWSVFGFLLVLSWVLFRENRSEATKIFSRDW